MKNENKGTPLNYLNNVTIVTSDKKLLSALYSTYIFNFS